jgi:catechol 2,3-dioxygenase-like lactoylglutathione lyase family enzyme
MRLNQVTVGATDFEASMAFYHALGLRLIVSARGEYVRSAFRKLGVPWSTIPTR